MPAVTKPSAPLPWMKDVRVDRWTVSATSRRASDGPRPRKCLCCRTLFDSEWSGERVCKRCQSGTAWKQGWGAP